MYDMYNMPQNCFCSIILRQQVSNSVTDQTGCIKMMSFSYMV